MGYSEKVYVGYVGAGAITFGAHNVLWNHSERIEGILRDRLVVPVIIDPNHDRFKEIMEQKAGKDFAESYEKTQWFSNPQEAAMGLDNEVKDKIDFWILAAPPHFRGTTIEGRDLELEMIKLFGSKPNYFVEKPIATTRSDEPHKVAPQLAANKAVIGIGYMMRYLKVVQKVMTTIKENNLRVMMVTGRYACAYKECEKTPWWMKSQQGGPIIEQATHFCDLMRYIGGDVDMDSVQATTLEHTEPAGEIGVVNVDEQSIPPEDRIPRATSAFWKFNSGAIGSLTHIVALHGIRYSNEISIYADGYQFRINDVYTQPVLHMRTPEDDSKEQVFTYPDEDMFHNEFYSFLSSAINKAGKSPLPTEDLLSTEFLSDFADASKTFELTWRIRDISDANAEKLLKQKQQQNGKSATKETVANSTATDNSVAALN